MDRTTKIHELKRAIKEEGEKLVSLSQAHMEEVKEKEGEEKDKLVKEYQTKLAEIRALYTGLLDELKMTRMNKTGSTFFSFTPSGMNRQQRRMARKLNRQKK